MTLRLAIWIVAVVLVAALSAHGADTTTSTAYDETNVTGRDDKTFAEGKAREKRLDAEIKAGAGSKWDGYYGASDSYDLGIFMTLSLRSGFTQFTYGCTGVYELNYGSVEEKDGRLILKPELPLKWNPTTSCPVDLLVPVVVEGRDYLIREGSLPQLVNCLNAGLDWEHVQGFRRQEDDTTIALTSGPTHLPPEYAAHLRSRDFSASISKVEGVTYKPNREDWMEKVTSVSLTTDSPEGFYPGMELYVVDPPGIERAVVWQGNGQTAQATITRLSEPFQSPAPGWKFSIAGPDSKRKALRWSR
ncbi:MAG: hypothetical protein K1X53_17460 [Candidatus Sumerlaeaceae bacterium]|nr:hypothetical protein [Candidatus Sumerlaeaceae bacterium]